MKMPAFRGWVGGSLVLGLLLGPVLLQAQAPSAPPPEPRLEAIAAQSRDGKKAQKALVEGRWAKAQHEADSLFMVTLNQESFIPEDVAAALAFRALAYAGAGEEAAALCRWNIAVDLWPALASADLSGYGEAGVLLKRESPADVAKAAGKPVLPAEELKPVRQTAPRFTRMAKKAGFRGGVRMAAFVDSQGRVIGSRPAGPLPFGLEAPARDTVCDWQFSPSANLSAGTNVSGMVTVPFLPFIGLPAPLDWGGHVPNNRPGKESSGAPASRY